MNLTTHDCKEELQEVQLKATPARLATLHVLENADIPLDVASIMAKLNESGLKIDPATLFRMMNAFSSKGIVKEINLQESKLRYEHKSKATHHHFICDDCGDITDISTCSIPALEKEIEQKEGLRITSHSLEFFGVCRNCQE